MILTVLWEDQRAAVAKRFGPHELLLACVADYSGRPKGELKNLISAVPKKGATNVLEALKQELSKLAKRGPVFAVIDRDKIRDVWRHRDDPPHDCIQAIRERILREARGSYELVFLVHNVESLVEACCEATGQPKPTSKPSPNERDDIIGRAASEAKTRGLVVAACQSFGRLVEKVSAALPPKPEVEHEPVK